MYNFASTAGGGAMALPYRVARDCTAQTDQPGAVAGSVKKPANQK